MLQSALVVLLGSRNHKKSNVSLASSNLPPMIRHSDTKVFRSLMVLRCKYYKTSYNFLLFEKFLRFNGSKHVIATNRYTHRKYIVQPEECRRAISDVV
jgi:hypothetical protein